MHVLGLIFRTYFLHTLQTILVLPTLLSSGVDQGTYVSTENCLITKTNVNCSQVVDLQNRHSVKFTRVQYWYTTCACLYLGTYVCMCISTLCVIIGFNHCRVFSYSYYHSY